MQQSTLVLVAPISGHTLNIQDVPDPVFSSKMVGDGISIDPISQCLLAPCKGVVQQIHRACHAVTIVSPLGPEVLMHIGLDTVSLNGTGFSPLVKEGDEVAVGTPLIEFDADLVASKAKSLLTEILITNLDSIAGFTVHPGQLEAGKDAVLTLTLADNSTVATAITQPAEEAVTSLDITILNPQGLHARPAAVLAKTAKAYQCSLEMLLDGRSANCKSVSSLLTLQTVCGSVVHLRARGANAAQAIEAVSAALAAGLGEEVQACPPVSATASAPESSPSLAADSGTADELATSDTPGILKGIAASSGIALGYIFQLRRQNYEIPEKAGTPAEEQQKLRKAVEQGKNELEFIETSLRAQTDPQKAGIFAAHRELLDDPDLVEPAFASIAAGYSAAYSWKQAFSAQASQLASLKHELLAARAADVRDVGQRVLRLIMGDQPRLPEMPSRTILIAEDLTPSDTATLDRSRVLGFATVLGGATSHASILARSLDLPAIAAISPQALSLPNNTLALLDGNKGLLKTNLSEDEAAFAQAKLEKQTQHRQLLLAKAHEPAITADGHRLEVAANVGGLADTEQAVSLGAEGVGLLRSEFLFMGRQEPPTEEQQAEIYCDIARALGPDLPLVIRTLDVGGDKPLAYLPIPKEDNPFLGERGIRVGLRRQDLLRTQFRAILRAAGITKLFVMLPMVTSVEEFRQAKAIFEEARTSLEAPSVPLGVMIEVPAAAILAETLAKEADFFSVGTNDLTQYTLAIDRGHPKLAAMADGLNPAVLKLIQLTIAGAHKHHRWVGICGGIAGELAAVPILVGLGADELSVASPLVPAVKQAIRTTSLEQCQALAQQALQCASAAEVRALTEVEE